MSTVRQPTRSAVAPADGDAVVPMSRLLRVELRKLVDTRSGRWLLVVIALLTAAAITITLVAAGADDLTLASFVTAAGVPQGLLLPILGILTVTSEWGQRTGLVTFTLEPHRSRVVVAKLLAVVTLGLAALVAALVLAVAGNVLGMAVRDGDGSWALGAFGLRDLLVLQLLGVVQGLAYGMLVMNGAGAIVTYFAIPTVWGFLTATVELFRRLGGWIDLNTTQAPLQAHEMTGDAWARLAVAVLVWIALPLALGWVRLLRRELKSA